MDRDIVVWLAEHRVGVLDALATVFAVVGTGGLVWVAIAAAAALARRSRMPGLIIWVAGTVWITDAVALGMRHLIGRARPYQVIPGVDAGVDVGGGGPSLPSGHAATSVAGAVVLGFLLRRAVPALAALAAAIAVSRVYAGLHYPTDVLAGAGLGSLLGLVGATAAHRFVPRSPR